nr:hypothetical protein [Cupriavidus gilardii]
MKVKPDRSDSRSAPRRRRLVAGGLLALLMAPLWQASPVHAQSPGIGALTQGHGRPPGRGAAGARRDGERRAIPPEGRPRGNRQRGDRQAADRSGRGNDARLSPDERRRLRQNLYELGREMYHGS